MNDSRTELRRRLIAARDALSDEVQHGAATRVRDRVVALLEGRSPSTVAGYLARDGEVDLGPTLSQLSDVGWTTVLPVIRPRFRLEFAPWSTGDELRDNRYGIAEPVSDSVAPDSIDVVLAPGVGFDRSGARIGHGAGFYDRFLAGCLDRGHEPAVVGIAHDVQIVDLPTPEEWDVPMHAVVTPSEVMRVAALPTG